MHRQVTENIEKMQEVGVKIKVVSRLKAKQIKHKQKKTNESF